MKKILFILFLSCLFLSCSKNIDTPKNHIEYRVECNTPNPSLLQLIYTDENGQKTSPDVWSSDWAIGFYTNKKPFPASLAAATYSEAGKTLTLTIKVNGRVVAKTTKQSDPSWFYFETELQYLIE